ncbi:hypothetical protein P154DRAFT_518299 [Amniculicola lignicola CBS 123094]|uniref:Uncharacterized protein n=1 Tax=Amniculicola lignicola CBS 123094 TaxID=1392246 RepID=A0A6A5WXP8_9PLEO|nr:hypothetical protein P154DRAFT_518299 [Amniculicola lignicola CBS 123094]
MKLALAATTLLGLALATPLPSAQLGPDLEKRGCGGYANFNQCRQGRANLCVASCLGSGFFMKASCLSGCVNSASEFCQATC